MEDKEVDKTQQVMLKGYLGIAKLALKLTVYFFKKKIPQKIKNGIVSLASKAKNGVQHLNQWRKNRQVTKQPNQTMKQTLDKKQSAQKLMGKESKALIKKREMPLLPKTNVQSRVINPFRHTINRFNQLLMRGAKFVLPLLPRVIRNAVLRNNTVTRDRGTRELGTAVKDSKAIPARTEKLQINNTIAKPTHAQMLQNNVPKKYKPLSELTTHARKISAINNNKAKEVSRALPQRRTSIHTINTGR